MWLLNFIPNFTIHMILFLSIIGIFLSVYSRQIPFISQYIVPLEIISIVLFTLAVWFEGGIAREDTYNAEIAKLKIKVAESEAKSANVNTKIEYVLVDKVKKVKEVQVVIQEKIKEVAGKIDANCNISPEVITLHNNSARNSTP